MIIRQILNNNVAIVKKGSSKQNRGNEIIVYSKGIAFKRKAGDSIEEKDIEKIYQKADDRMYEYKKEYKLRTGTKRGMA